jgi:hypothetical protein
MVDYPKFPASHAAKTHHEKCIASAQVFAHSLLTGFMWQSAQLAAKLLWEETEAFHKNTAEAAQIKRLVQLQSVRLHCDAWVAPDVEHCLFAMQYSTGKEARKKLTDAIAWSIVARLDESRQIDHTAQQVCPDLCAHEARRSQLMNSIHKGMRYLTHMGNFLVSYHVASASMLGAAKKRKKGGTKSRRGPDASQDEESQLHHLDGQCERPEETDQSDCSSLLAEACDAERRDAFEREEHADAEDELIMEVFLSALR